MTNLRLVGMQDENPLRTTLTYWAEQEADSQKYSEKLFGDTTYFAKRDDLPAKTQPGIRGLAYRVESLELIARNSNQIIELVNGVPKDLKKAYSSTDGRLIIRRPLTPEESNELRKSKLRLAG